MPLLLGQLTRQLNAPDPKLLCRAPNMTRAREQRKAVHTPSAIATPANPKQAVRYAVGSPDVGDEFLPCEDLRNNLTPR
jgi:hypothetical protein